MNLELRAAGIPVWWDPAIRVGSRWASEIDGVLARIRALVVLWSPNSVDSEWVLWEARVGAQRNMLVPALIADAQLPGEFAMMEAADLRGWKPGVYNPEFGNLVSALHTIHGWPGWWRGETVGWQQGWMTFATSLQFERRVFAVRAVSGHTATSVDGQIIGSGKGSTTWSLNLRDGVRLRACTVEVGVAAILKSLKSVKITVDGVTLVHWSV